MNTARDIDVVETAKIIRATLKQAFPKTKFSVRTSKYSMGCSITIHWTDGPTQKQVSPILDRFNGSGFDGMVDLAFHCGERTYKGEFVDFNSGYVRGSRSESFELLSAVADVVAYECGAATPEVTHGEYAYVNGGNFNVPFNWHQFWEGDNLLTLEQLQSGKHILASDSTKGEYLNTLISRIASAVSMESQQPVELPEYIDLEATVSTGRASFEQPMRKFEGHAELNRKGY